jgi:hypothetical protein
MPAGENGYNLPADTIGELIIRHALGGGVNLDTGFLSPR